MQVEFELTGCTALTCQRTFALEKYETSTENSTAARDTRNYQLVTRVATELEDDTRLIRQNQTREINFESEESGFYVAIVDESTCIAVTHIIVFYHVCPEGNEELVMRPETIAPIVDRTSIPIAVTAECVAGASPDNEDAVRLNCNQGGVWTMIAGSGCSCNPRFKTSDDGRSCLGKFVIVAIIHILMNCIMYYTVLCVSGQYYSVLNEECRDCPENSEGMESGLIECPCEEGYYRASGEEDLPCTRELHALSATLSKSGCGIVRAWHWTGRLGCGIGQGGQGVALDRESQGVALNREVMQGVALDREVRVRHWTGMSVCGIGQGGQGVALDREFTA